MGERGPGWHGAATCTPVLQRGCPGTGGTGQPALSWPGRTGAFARRCLAVGRNDGDSRRICTGTSVRESWGQTSARQPGGSRREHWGSALPALPSPQPWGKGTPAGAIAAHPGTVPSRHQPAAPWRGTGRPAQSLACCHQQRGLGLSSLKARFSNSFKPIVFYFGSEGLLASHRLGKSSVCVH